MALDPATEADIKWALQAFQYRLPEQILYANYIAGEHAFNFATTQYARAFRQLLRGLRLNMCPAVIHTISDRLKVIGFTGNDTGNKTAAAAAWQMWQDCRLDRHANQVHSEALVSGDAYLIVWPDDDGDVCFYPQQGRDCIVRYDPERRSIVQMAVKFWLDGGKYRINVYYPDRIEKYRSANSTAQPASDNGQASPAIQTLFGAPSIPASASSFEPYQPDTDSTWPVANEYGIVPVFHFANDAGIGQWGISELRDVVPLQDAINKLLADMLVASEFGAFRQRYAIGMVAEYDDEGNEIPIKMKTGVDRLLTIANDNAKFGEFEATDLANYNASIAERVSDIARIKGIPLHQLMMTGSFPSGESQKTAEQRLVSKVEDTQTDFGDVWEDVMQFALLVSGKADASITAEWKEAQSRAELEHAQNVGIQVTQMGLPDEQAWREMGYSDEQIATFKDMKAAQQATATAAFNQAFNRGTGLPVGRLP